VDFAFQCTGSPTAASEVFKYIRRGGGLCELGFFVDNGNANFNPHHDLCNKEITVVGSWVYSAQEYLLTMSFMNIAKAMNIPVAELVTDRFKLDDIVKAMEANIAMGGLKVAVVI
jgi:L-iditol 2-dehydrogenase